MIRAEMIRAAYDKASGNNYRYIHAVRRAAGLDRAAFDQALEQGWVDGLWVCHGGNPELLSESEIEDAWRYDGRLYLTMTWRAN